LWVGVGISLGLGIAWDIGTKYYDDNDGIANGCDDRPLEQRLEYKDDKDTDSVNDVLDDDFLNICRAFPNLEECQKINPPVCPD
jgi:hypothetical protein